MKQSPQVVDLDVILRSSALVAGGFMGQDARSVTEVIDTDAGTLFKLGVTARQIADRMKEITDTAAQALGTWTQIDARHQAIVDEVRGVLPCPWPHPGNYFKRVTTLRHSDSGKTLHWSDLNIHMIAAHGFFEGHGSVFRTAPAELADALF